MHIDRHPLPTILISGDGSLISANAPACSMTGLHPEGVRGVVLERVLQPSEGGLSIERFLGDLLTRGQARFDGLLLGGAHRHRVTAWGWRPSAEMPEFWIHLVPAPPPRTNVPAPAAPPPDELSHLTPSFRGILKSPAHVEELLRLGAGGGVLARELLADLLNLAGQLRGQTRVRDELAALVRVATMLSEHTERMAELTGTAGELVPDAINIKELLRATATLLEGALPEDIHVHVEVEDGTPDALCNALALEQAILALCANAREAMPVGGYLILEAHPAEDDRLELHIRDTGGGMRTDSVDAIFAPTYTTRGAMSGQPRGMGLGLPLVRELMDRMGGIVTVASSTSIGTTVVINLPAQAPERAVEPVGTRPQVLLVEDDAELRRVTARLLQQSGMEPVPVVDGAEALQALTQSGPFAALLLDLNTPRADGRDVLQFIRVMENPPPVVVFTSEDPNGIREELTELGAFAVLAKPFRGQDLVETLRESMRNGQ